MTNETISVYVAGPDGFSEATRDFMEQRLLPWLRGLGIRVINPWEMTTGQEVADVYGMPDGAEKDRAVDDLNMRIGRRNYEEGIVPCTFVIANLDGQEVDSGTAAEIGAAAALGKRIYGRRSDLRLSGELGAVVNLQVAYFVRMHGGSIAHSFAELQPLVEAYVTELRTI
jgi:nucleoside 2-deoxyribosyltransferase